MFPVGDQKAAECLGGEKCEIIHKSEFIALRLEVKRRSRKYMGSWGYSSSHSFEILGHTGCGLSDVCLLPQALELDSLTEFRFHIWGFLTFIQYLSIYVSIYISVWMDVHVPQCVWSGVGSLLPLCGTWGVNSGCKAWWQVPTGPSWMPLFVFNWQLLGVCIHGVHCMPWSMDMHCVCVYSPTL